MNDEDYQRLLRALAAKHLAAEAEMRRDVHYLMHADYDLRRDLETLSASARLLKLVQRRPGDTALEHTFREDLIQSSPIERTKRALEETGILAALEEAGPVLFAQLRRMAIPEEDFQFLREAGYTDQEIEILFAVAIHHAHTFLASSESVSHQLTEATKAFREAVERLEQISTQENVPTVKKRKIFNGIGKVLGGSIAGLGNALMATGTILAPNPATAAGAIASAAVAVPAIMCGIGDLRGE